MKSLFFDVETTGLDPRRCAIIQFAGIIDIDGAVAADIELKIRPFAAAQLDKSALDLLGIEPPIFETKEYVDEVQAYSTISSWFSRFVNKFDPHDKLIPVAYNGGFDMDFVTELWNRHGDKYLGSYVDRARLVDPLRVVAWRLYATEPGLIAGSDIAPQLVNLKLTTVCKAFGIPVEGAHDAMSDVRMLRALTYVLKGDRPKPISDAQVKAPESE